MNPNTIEDERYQSGLNSHRATQPLVDPDALSDRKSTISGKASVQRYFSNRLSRSRGAVRDIEKSSGIKVKADAVTRASEDDRRSLVSVKTRQSR